LGKVYYKVFEWMGEKEKYRGKKEFINFERVYREHFVVIDRKVSSRPAEGIEQRHAAIAR